MRIPWPDYIKYQHALAFAICLLAAQLLLGTSAVYAIIIFLYVLFTITAFNIAGGLSTFSGSFIAFQSLQSIMIAQVAKVFYLQPADLNLHSPVTTAAVYASGEFSLIFAVAFARRYRRRPPVLDSRADAKFTMAISMSASAIGILSAFLVGTVGTDVYGNVEQGSVWSYLNQLGNFLLIGIVVGTAHIIQVSQGRRSARWWTIIPMAIYLTLGIVNNTKQGIYQPLALWVMVCAIYRYKFNRMQVVGLIASGIAGVMVVFPVVQYSRGYVREGALLNRAVLVYDFMRDHSISEIRASYKADEELKEEGAHAGYYFYYGKDAQLLDRVSLISVDDAAVNYTLRTGTHGYDAFTQIFIAMIPRVFLPDKDKYLHISIVNDLGRELGILAPTDENTFIAFSLFGPSFYMGGWWAVTVLTFLVMALMFWFLETFYGTARESLYALLPIAENLHGSAEMILPVAFASILHLCLIATAVMWVLRRVASFVQIFIQRYGWYEKPPQDFAPPRAIPRRPDPGPPPVVSAEAFT